MIFELVKPLKYSHQNEQVECGHIELREPTGKVSGTCMAIEGLIQSSLLNMAESLGDDFIAAAKEEAVETESKPDADAVLALMVGGGVDMEKVTLHFRELFKQVAWMGGEKQITVPRMDEMTHKDFRRMMGEYAANFILN
jgi:hypothetical protein